MSTSIQLLPIVPAILQVLPFVAAFCLVCAPTMRAHPVAFYVPWAAVVVAGTVVEDPGSIPYVGRAVELLSSAYVGVSFYLVVMFIGAFERTPWVKRLLSARSELSVIGGVVVLGHMVRVSKLLVMSLLPMWGQIWGHPAAEVMFAATTLVGVPLSLLFLVPWVTSFKFVRRRMEPRTWKRVQRLAYPFMGLMCLQGMLLPLAHALYGYPYTGRAALSAIAADPAGWAATLAQQVGTFWTYAFLGVSYAVLRVRKHRRDVERKRELGQGARQG